MLSADVTDMERIAAWAAAVPDVGAPCKSDSESRRPVPPAK